MVKRMLGIDGSRSGIFLAPSRSRLRWTEEEDRFGEGRANWLDEFCSELTIPRQGPQRKFEEGDGKKMLQKQENLGAAAEAGESWCSRYDNKNNIWFASPFFSFRFKILFSRIFVRQLQNVV